MCTFVFNFFDCNNDGYVTVKDINNFIFSFRPLVEMAIEFVVNKFDKDHNGKLNY